MEKSYHGLAALDRIQKECIDGAIPTHFPQSFGYLFGANPVFLGSLTRAEVVAAFDALVDGMDQTPLKEGPGSAEAGQTFFGQFIDHDITLDATSAIGTRIDPRSIRNVRTPTLDLDCVYADGPEASPHLYSHDPATRNYLLYGTPANEYDLPRNQHGRALIGDPRNDENILVSQVHGAFIALHNILMTQVESDPAVANAVRHCAKMGTRDAVWDELITDKKMAFEMVRRFIRLHYQHMVLKDFLPSFVEQAVIDAVVAHDPFHDQGPIMPVEFSVAAFRFGHATVQQSYVLNSASGAVALFEPGMNGFEPRGRDVTIEMARFFGTGADLQKARPLGTSMPPVLFTLPDNVVSGPLDWNGFEISEARAKKLALRNILRDRTSLSLFSGHMAAAALGVDPVPTPQVLTDARIDKTPLWFYVLQEAQEGAGKLTGVGGRIVASVLIQLLKRDPESVWHIDFEPWDGFGPACTMGSVMAYVEAHRDAVKDRESLFNG